MIDCKKCKSQNISIVSVANSQQNEKILKILHTIQAVTVAIETVLLFIVIGLLIDDEKLFISILTGTYQITNVVSDMAQLAGSVVLIKIVVGAFGGLFKIIVICGIIKIFLPYRTYSYQKCICRACEFQWEYYPPSGITDIGSEHIKP